MNIIKCDGGCGKESPDPVSGRHEANHWKKVRVADSLRDMDRTPPGGDLVYCGDCWPRIDAALKNPPVSTRQGGKTSWLRRLLRGAA